MLSKEDLKQISDLMDEKMNKRFAEQTDAIKREFAVQNLYINNMADRIKSDMTELIDQKIDKLDHKLSGRMDKMDERLYGMDKRIDRLDRKIDDKFYEQQLWLENHYDPYVKRALEYLPVAPKTYAELDDRTSQNEIDIIDLRVLIRDHEERIQRVEGA